MLISWERDVRKYLCTNLIEFKKKNCILNGKLQAQPINSGDVYPTAYIAKFRVNIDTYLSSQTCSNRLVSMIFLLTQQDRRHFCWIEKRCFCRIKTKNKMNTWRCNYIVFYRLLAEGHFLRKLYAGFSRTQVSKIVHAAIPCHRPSWTVSEKINEKLLLASNFLPIKIIVAQYTCRVNKRTCSVWRKIFLRNILDALSSFSK